MRPNIIVCHGLAPKPHPEELRKKCSFALERPVSIAYYADLMGHPFVQDHTRMRRYTPLESVRLNVAAGLRRAFKSAFEHGIAQALGQESTSRSLLTKCQHRLIRWTNAAAFKTYADFLPDLAKYFGDEKLRRKVMVRFADLFYSADQPIVIAHSMGTIVALDCVLHGWTKISKLITIGSPLGLSIVQNQLHVNDKGKHTLGGWIKEWYNISDPLDIVALDYDLAEEYPYNKIEDISTWNEAVDEKGKRHHHSLLGYLHSRQVRNLIP